ncbi:transposable element Tcb2 transposase [Trichonephila clavipes]|nr:transposable element Tcb2 transposase [Trichonephila clavipes]
MSTISQRSHLTDSEAWRVVGRIEGSQTQAEVAQVIGVSQSVISRIWNRFWRLEVQAKDQDKTPKYERYSSPTNFRSATGTTVSTQTVRNWLHGVGLYARRLMVCVRLTSRHRRDTREWATEHVNWRRNEWSNVLFSDKSRFPVHPDNRHIFIWRDRGSRNNPAFVHESVRFDGGGVLVDEILRPIVVLYAAAIGDDFILMEDNCRPHRVNLVEDFLFEEGIVRMEWPACSPDRNPIEHVWDALGRRVADRQPPP